MLTVDSVGCRSTDHAVQMLWMNNREGPWDPGIFDDGTDPVAIEYSLLFCSIVAYIVDKMNCSN